MILLTTPYDPGDLDPGQTYTHVKVVNTFQEWHPNDSVPGAPTLRLAMYWCYGQVVDSEFVAGKAVKRKFSVDQTIWDARIDTYLSAGSGEKSWKAWEIALHQCLLDESVVAGTLA